MAGDLAGLAPAATTFSVSTVREFATPTCVVDREVVLRDPAGDLAFVRVLQLARPLNAGSFPLLGESLARVDRPDGSVLVSNHVADSSAVEAVSVAADGLLVDVQVRSASGPDTSGFPTTMPPAPSSAPPGPAPITEAGATTLAGDVTSQVTAAG
jgi:hypothetical protein